MYTIAALKLVRMIERKNLNLKKLMLYLVFKMLIINT